jgi:hypothetical protein
MPTIRLAAVSAIGLNVQQENSQLKDMFPYQICSRALSPHELFFAKCEYANCFLSKMMLVPKMSPFPSLYFDLIHHHTTKSLRCVSQVVIVIQKGCYCNQIIQI